MQMTDVDDRTAAEAFRRLVAHLQHRTDAQNVDLMGLAGFCRNCLGDWLCEASGGATNALLPPASSLSLPLLPSLFPLLDAFSGHLPTHTRSSVKGRLAPRASPRHTGDARRVCAIG